MCPSGTGYNYFLACDTAERIIFAVVAGSGSGKLCWHSRGNDNDQENAGYMRESAGDSEQVLRLRARDGAFRAPARVPFFFCKKKGTKENHLDLRSKDPLARYGSCRFGGVYSRAGCSGHHCRSKGLCLRSPARRLPRPLAPATVGVFASTGLAIIKSRLCRRKAAKVGVPVGHGYNYFLACDTVERIIFTIVTGSGSGKLCWHSRGNDNDQENAGYVRENGQRRTGVAR